MESEYSSCPSKFRSAHMAVGAQEYCIMPEPPNKKARVAAAAKRPVPIETPTTGAAIVFWHEAEGAPPGIRAIPLQDLEPLEPGQAVTEKAVCRAFYRGIYYHCIVIWIEYDKTPDELASCRLFPSSMEKTFEEKGYRWATELGLMKAKSEVAEHSHTNGKTQWFPSDAPLEPRSSSWDSTSEAHEESPDGERVTRAAFLNGGSVSMAPGPSRQMQEAMLSAYRQRQQELLLSAHQQMKSSGSLEDEGVVADRTPFSSSNSPSSPVGLSGQTQDEILENMMPQSTWKKALKIAMKKMFTTDELVTSVPTERGARMSKFGKKPLDQERLNVVKILIERYCEQKDIYPAPTKELIHQELGGILFSIRESTKKVKAPKRPKKPTMVEPERQQHGKRKGAPTKVYPSYKFPSFASGTPLDLSDLRTPPPDSVG